MLPRSLNTSQGGKIIAGHVAISWSRLIRISYRLRWFELFLQQ